MEKPETIRKEYYDWGQCSTYIEWKYKVRLHDVEGKHTPANRGNLNVPYQNFWHWLIDGNNIGNPGTFCMPLPEEIEPWEDDSLWVKNILEMFAAEFDIANIEFYVSW